MEEQSIKFKITGTRPLLMHNARLSDPMDEYSVQIKELTSKQKKTKEDRLRCADLEFEGGLYLDDDGRVILPPQNIEALLHTGAKKTKDGKTMLAAVAVYEPSLLDYNGGPKTLKKLLTEGIYRDRRSVPVQRNRVMRTRPRFNQWSLTFTMHYRPDLCDAKDITGWLRDAEPWGLGDYRPKFGQFVSEVIE